MEKYNAFLIHIIFISLYILINNGKSSVLSLPINGSQQTFTNANVSFSMDHKEDKFVVKFVIHEANIRTLLNTFTNESGVNDSNLTNVDAKENNLNTTPLIIDTTTTTTEINLIDNDGSESNSSTKVLVIDRHKNSISEVDIEIPDKVSMKNREEIIMNYRNKIIALENALQSDISFNDEGFLRRTFYFKDGFQIECLYIRDNSTVLSKHRIKCSLNDDNFIMKYEEENNREFSTNGRIYRDEPLPAGEYYK